MTMTKHPQTPISPLFPPSYFLLAELDPDPPPSPLAPSQPLGAPWTHSLFQDLEHPQNCSRSWDIARIAVGPGIFPGLLGNWDIPRTAWGLGYPQDCLGIGISPRTAWGLGYLSDLGTWEHIWLLWNAVSAQKHPSGVCVSRLFSKPSLVLVLCFVFIFFQSRESSYFSYLNYVLVSFSRRTEWMECIYIRRGCIRLAYMIWTFTLES